MKATTCQNCSTAIALEDARTGEAPAPAGGFSSFRTVRTFMKTGTCSEALMNVVDRAFDRPMDIEERGVAPLAGGIAQQGYQCGMLWGTTLAAGAEAYRRFGAGPQAEAAAVAAAQRIADSFFDRNGSINCLEITDTDWTRKLSMLKNFLKGGPISCMRLAARTAPQAFDDINAALAEPPAEPPCSPASCASMLARKIGLTEKQVVMAAGLAGGIGLNGGGCGALGAAVWAVGMECARDDAGYDAMNKKAREVIEKFLEVSGYEFECTEIVGRRFESIEAHADHLRDGGCSEIIEALAEAVHSVVCSSTRDTRAESAA